MSASARTSKGWPADANPTAFSASSSTSRSAGCFLEGELGQRVGLQPLVSDGLAAADRPAVAAGGKPGLGPLQRRPLCSQELVDGHAGLVGVAPVGVVDVIAQLGRLRLVGRSLE
jgi:hypothetical protein